MEKALEIENVWLEDFNVGLIRITKQKYRNENFFQGSSKFVASDKMELRSEVFPEYSMYNGEVLFVRGSDFSRDNETIIIRNNTKFFRFLQAVNEYNAAIEKEDSNYVRLHKLLWVKLAESGSLDKEAACEEVMKEENITKPPLNSCFLCQGVYDKKKGCKYCKGFWGGEGMVCQDKGSYFQMWCNEKDIVLRKALALRIANNIKM
jgi:hypothetical protein